MSFYPELDGLSLPELVRRFGVKSPEGALYAATYRDEVALHIRKHGKKGSDFLLKQLGSGSASRVTAALLALVKKGPGRLKVETALQLLGDPRPKVVAEAVDSLTHLKYKRAVLRVLSLLSSPNPFVIGAVLRHVRKIDPVRAKPLLLLALGHKKHIVRQNACDELEALGCREALPTLKTLSRDPHPNVREAAEDAVAFLRKHGR